MICFHKFLDSFVRFPEKHENLAEKSVKFRGKNRLLLKSVNITDYFIFKMLNILM